jgi:hypothetical protein
MVVATVLEVGLGQVKYQPVHPPGAPAYVVEKSKLISIVYASGVSETFNKALTKTVAPLPLEVDADGAVHRGDKRKLSIRYLQKLMMLTNDTATIQHITEAKHYQAYARVLTLLSMPVGIAGAIVFSGAVNQQRHEGRTHLFSYLSGTIALALCPLMVHAGKKAAEEQQAHLRSAVQLFNNGIASGAYKGK